MQIKIRLGNLELRKAVYICKEPKYPSYHIDKWEPNKYYKQEREYIKDGDYYRPKDSYKYRIHKNCFKNPETCYSVASFHRDKEGFYELRFICDRPLNLSKEEREIFWKLVSIGNDILNNMNNVEI
jgi:hypothetical protein